MDPELLTSVVGALPNLGPLGGMFLMVVILLRWQGQTSTRHGEEVDRMARLHDSELAEARAERDLYRSQRDAAETRLREVYGLPESHPPLPPSSGPPPASPRPGRRRRDP